MAITPAKLLEEWKKKLLDLSKRNRLLNFRSTKRGTLQIVFPDFEKLFYDVLDEKSLHFAKPNDENEFTAYIENPSSKHAFEIRSNKVELSDEIATLRALRRKAKTITEEQGINVLHLAFGFIRWKESENSSDEYLSPLILVPVSLNIENVISPYELSLNDDDVTVNPTLCYKLEHDYNINLPEYDPEEGLDSFFRKCEKIIRGQKGWSIEKSVQLSIFSYLKINMYNDLEDNSDVVKANSIVKALGGDLSSLDSNDHAITEVEGLNFDKDQKPDSVYQVLDADSSQQEAIELAKKGVSFVLQGPPGTGKSQTITNIIAESLAAGKKSFLYLKKRQRLMLFVID